MEPDTAAKGIVVPMLLPLHVPMSTPNCKVVQYAAYWIVVVTVALLVTPLSRG